MEEAVERAVAAMRSRYDERLSVADLAAEAFFSPFHFSRIFRRELGVSPVQYLTAVRLFEAKRLLQATSLNVADIACRVGYVGIGTFTTRFTTLVGVPPGHYRRLPASRMLAIADGIRQLPTWNEAPAAAAHPPRTVRGGRIVGSTLPVAGSAVRRLFVGVFDDAIPQGPPVAWRLVTGDDIGRWRLDDIPAGRWVVIAVADGGAATGESLGGNGVAAAADRNRPFCWLAAQAPATFSVGISGQLHVMSGTITRVALRLRQPQRTDPPILIPLCNRITHPTRLAA